MPMWEGEEPTPSEGGPTPKQRLLNWIQTKIPDLPIKNFTTDWNDGRAIGALVDAVGPGRCPFITWIQAELTRIQTDFLNDMERVFILHIAKLTDS